MGVALGAAPHDLPIDFHVEVADLDDLPPPKTPTMISHIAKSTRPAVDAPHVPVSRAMILRNLKNTMANFAAPNV
jgi:hypothetical protein